jgi:hypothetical protein
MLQPGRHTAGCRPRAFDPPVRLERAFLRVSAGGSLSAGGCPVACVERQMPCFLPAEGRLMAVFLLLLSSAWAGWVQVDASGHCVVQHPDQHRMETVADSFRRREDLAAVEEAARARALSALFSSVCAGQGPADCDAIRKRVGVEVAVDLERRLICASALVPAEIVEDPGGRLKYDAALDELSARAAESLAGRPVGAVVARLSTGCGAGDAGVALASSVRAGLANRGVPVVQGEGDRLSLVVTPIADMANVELWRRPSAGGAEVQVGAARVATSWLGLTYSHGGECRGDSKLGIGRSGTAPGSGGLTVAGTLATEGALCAGERTSLSIRSSAPARVQVWSVGRSGDAWLTWDSATEAAVGAGGLDRRASLELEAEYVPALGEETLLVVAWPLGERALPGGPGCRRMSLGAADLPASAARLALPFTVTPPGEGRCPTAAEDRAVYQSYQSAPLCR